MKAQPENASFFLKQLYYPQYIKSKSSNVVMVVCWFALILIGTLFIGASASNYYFTFDYCQASQNFCSKYFTITSSMNLYFYLKLDPFYQHNRLYLDSYSGAQLHGQIGNADNCGDFYTYESLDVTQTVGGYRVKSSSHAHPCGEPMKNILNDSIYIIDTEGGTPILDDGNLVSSFYTDNQFSRLSNYQILQWTDVNATNFVNWFTIPMTSVKYMPLGKLAMQPGNYQMVLRNNFPTNNQFAKSILITEIGIFGDANLVLGFSIFGAGILILFLHVFVCCRQKRRQS